MNFTSLIELCSVYSWLLRDQDDSYLIIWAFEEDKPLLREGHQKQQGLQPDQESAGLEDGIVDQKRTRSESEELTVALRW